MLGPLAAVFLVTNLVAAHTARAQSADFRGEVISTVLRDLSGELRRPHHLQAGRSQCVEEELLPSPFVPNADRLETVDASTLRIRRIRRLLVPEWFEVPGDEAGTEALRLAVLEVSRRSPSAAQRERVESTWLSPSQRFVPEPDDRFVLTCEHLEISDVAFAGPFAFIAYNLECGMLCGIGEVLALQRREAGWEVVARSRRWVS